MKLEVYCIFDAKAMAYANPFFFPQEGLALRAFADLCNDPETAVGCHPDDYTLFHIGRFDSDEGMLEPNLAPVTLGNGLEFVRLNEPVAIGDLVPGVPDGRLVEEKCNGS